MSGFGSLRKRAHEAAQSAEVVGRCAANGCPCRGSVSFDGGRWACTAHAFSFPDHWPRITEKLREHDWLVAFMDDVAGMDRAGGDWRAFAAQFWANQDQHCMPDKVESAATYGYRMRGELLYRCGLGKRPPVKHPKPVKVRGNAASFVKREAA
jgi:hypothetical protein